MTPPAQAGSASSLDWLLAKAASQGDAQSTQRLLESVAPRVARVVRLILGGAHPDCDDVVQVALFAFARNLPAFRGECEPLQYASRIAVRTAIRASRRARLQRERCGELAEDNEPESTTVHEAALAEHRSRAMRDLLATLPAEQADALALRVVLGWSLKEVADHCHIPLNTVRSRLRLAKEALRRRIEADAVLREQFGVR